MTPATSSAPTSSAPTSSAPTWAGVGSSGPARVRPSRMRLVQPVVRKLRVPAIRVPARASSRQAAGVEARPAWRSAVVRTVAIALAVVGLFAVVVAHVVIDQKQFRIDALQQQVAHAQARQTSLQFRLAQMEAPQRIIASAEQLGMVTPEQVTYLVPVALSPAPVTSNPSVLVPSPASAGGSVSPHVTSPSTSPSGSARARAPGR